MIPIIVMQKNPPIIISSIPVKKSAIGRANPGRNINIATFNNVARI